LTDLGGGAYARLRSRGGLPMKTVPITPAEMERRIARFRSTRPQSGYYADSGIPKEA